MDTYRCRYLLVRARTKRSKFMFCPIPLLRVRRIGQKVSKSMFCPLGRIVLALVEFLPISRCASWRL